MTTDIGPGCATLWACDDECKLSSIMITLPTTTGHAPALPSTGGSPVPGVSTSKGHGHFSHSNLLLLTIFLASDALTQQMTISDLTHHLDTPTCSHTDAAV